MGLQIDGILNIKLLYFDNVWIFVVIKDNYIAFARVSSSIFEVQLKNFNYFSQTETFWIW